MKTLLCLLLIGITAVCHANLETFDLRCEYKKNPIGLGEEHPRLSWKIRSEGNNISQVAYEIRSASNTADIERPNASTGKIESSMSTNLPYTGGELGSRDRIYWQVRVWDNYGNQSEWSEIAFFEMGLLRSEAWEAEWISQQGEQAIKGSRPSIYLRKEFSLEKNVKSARIYASALGLYELYVNGAKVGDQLFTPGWTSYNNRIQYQVYDITSMLKKNNVIGGILGDGWYRGFIGWQDQNDYYGNRRALISQIEVTYEDGSMEVITSDDTWKTSNGPIIKSDIYNGEICDKGLEQKGWNALNFKENELWTYAEVVDSSKSNLVASIGPPVKAIEEIQAVQIFKTPNGEVVLDLGQNMVGWVRLKVRGNAGDTVTIKFAEVLDKNGNFYTENLRSADATDKLILASSAETTYEPTFTFHGFRYVMVSGLSYMPKVEDVVGVVIHSDMQSAGNFTCSNDMINQLQHNIRWGQKGNFLDVPTDCPQRDERMGWTGDAQVFATTAAYNYDVASFYTKWMKDVAADQLENGKIPHVIPDVLKGGGGATGWGDASIIIPWKVYLLYGDKRILEDQYSSMKAWVEYMRSRAGEDHLWTGDFHFGDWLAFATTRSDYPGATTEKDLIATAYYSYSSGLLGKIATILGKDNDADSYSDLSKNIKLAFQKEFITPNGRLVSHTQTAYALALAFDLIPSELIAASGAYLAADVEKFKHLTTGFLGTPLLCKTLCDVGRDDLAFMLLNRKKYPSWLYPITQGATTIWERWDGQKPDGSFQDVGMNSFNHYAYGAIGEWLYQYVAGLMPDENYPGFKQFTLSPHVGGGLTNVALEYESMNGTIVSAWTLSDDVVNYSVRIPANTKAKVILPSATTLESSAEASSVANDQTFFDLGSGSYNFSWKLE